MLLEVNANVNIPLPSGATPLSIAKQKGHTAIVDLLNKANLLARQEKIKIENDSRYITWMADRAADSNKGCFPQPDSSNEKGVTIVAAKNTIS